MRHLVAAGLIILAVILSADPGRAFNEPRGFKEAKFGDSEELVRSKVKPDHCFEHSKETAWAGDRACGGPGTIGEIPVDVLYTFRANRLVAIYFYFKPDDFSDLKAAFVTRFGQPALSDKFVVKTGAGVEYLNEVLTWKGKTVGIDLVKYSGKVTEGSAGYVLLSDSATAAELRRQKGSKAAEDLK